MLHKGSQLAASGSQLLCIFPLNDYLIPVKSIFMKRTIAILYGLSILLAVGCKKETAQQTGARLIFKFKFDSTQARLNNIGQPSPMAAGNAGQSPVFNKMSAHYLELAPSAFTALGSGTIVYKAPETTAGGSNAIDFEKSSFAGNNEVFYSTPIKSVTPGEYEWIRLSLAYQNFDVKFYIDTVINGVTIRQEFPGTAAGFIGYNTYIKNFNIKNGGVAVNANKKQGFWGFETVMSFGGSSFPYTATGQAPEGATTVVNPLFASSPVPAGSCVVTSAFTPGKLRITGNETSDIVVEISLSTNKSFEWKDLIPNGKWEPTKGEQVVDMGIRGMTARW